ncbi:hypothetical protein RND81_05G012100 [Saponaria officinalis]|uniref:DUF7870 domain-containing protein n=1 Tax=Saponaria officinalis TaxID=3572 RepID=A0AAW1KTD5_SAPOF
MMKKHINAHSSETASLIDAAKPSIVRNLLVKILVFCVFIICFRFAYVVTIRGESCDVGDFCFFSLPETLTFSATAATAVETTAAISADAGSNVYASIFEDLMSEGFLTPKSKSLVVVDTVAGVGEEVSALRKLGVASAVGVAKKAAKPFVVGMKNSTLFPFNGENFDFVFSGNAEMVTLFSEEIQRTMKPEGYFVVHTKSNDTYSLHSLIALFNSCTFIKFRDIAYNYNSDDDNVGFIREIVMKKEYNGGGHVNNKRECEVVPGYKQDIVRKAENLIKEEPLKPWITLKKNIQNVKYLPNMVDISFKSRYVYVDVGARSYGSSIGSWFKKQYPKQNKTFDVYAIEADKSFYKEYAAKKKKVKLLPYAAWVKNETLFFEVNHDPGDDAQEKGASGRGMGRIKPVQSDKDGGVDKIIGFDFAEWLKATVTEKDFVVMKMDVEGTEFELIPRLIETGAICLIDEIFLECHYNRWQRCCPGERSAKYEKTYGQCLDLFTSLRNRGVLVHQWW